MTVEWTNEATALGEIEWLTRFLLGCEVRSFRISTSGTVKWNDGTTKIRQYA